MIEEGLERLRRSRAGVPGKAGALRELAENYGARVSSYGDDLRVNLPKLETTSDAKGQGTSQSVRSAAGRWTPR